jgi:hypothetical protein
MCGEVFFGRALNKTVISRPRESAWISIKALVDGQSCPWRGDFTFLLPLIIFQFICFHRIAAAKNTPKVSSSLGADNRMTFRLREPLETEGAIGWNSKGDNDRSDEREQVWLWLIFRAFEECPRDWSLTLGRDGKESEKREANDWAINACTGQIWLLGQGANACT